jgi:hypothetical protein
MKRLFGKEFNIKKIWNNLDKNQRFSLSILVFLLISFPVSLLLSLSPVRLFSRAQLPASPPITPTITGSDCSPVDKVILVYPKGAGRCDDIQRAIDNVTGSGYTIRFVTGNHDVPDSGDTFGLRIVGKENITFEPQETPGCISCVVQLFLSRNRGGIEIIDSSGKFSDIRVYGNTSNGLLWISRASNFNFYKSVFQDDTANPVRIASSSHITLNDVAVFGNTVGITIENSQRIEIQNSRIYRNSVGIQISGSDVGIRNNLIEFNSQRAIQMVSSTSTMYRNTITYSDGDTESEAAVFADSSHFVMEKNIVAFNAGGVEVRNPPFQSYLFSRNDIFNKDPTKNYIGIRDQTGDMGNISEDPLFGSNYCLKEGSPAIFDDWGQLSYMGHKGPCAGVPTPTFTITPTARPVTSTPTPTETSIPTPTPPVASAIPTFRTRYLKPGMSGRKYKTFIRGEDRDRDKLTLEARGLPKGVSLKECKVTYSSNVSRITCEISGVPGMSGIYRSVFELRDDTGAGVTGGYTLIIFPKFLP